MSTTTTTPTPEALRARQIEILNLPTNQAAEALREEVRSAGLARTQAIQALEDAKWANTEWIAFARSQKRLITAGEIVSLAGVSRQWVSQVPPARLPATPDPAFQQLPADAV